jgi:TetR/AcrR family transcriptional regulator, transcriptional repressor for nem operon
MTSTRDRLLDAATLLFAEQGYQATSISEIARRAEANPGSLYFFFPTKQELLVAVLERYRAGITAMLLEPAWRGVDDPIERVFALLGHYRRLLLQSDCAYGCPIGSLALELHEPDPVVREQLAANFAAWTAAIEACLEAARHRLPAGVEPLVLARFVLTTMEGGVMLARTERRPDPFDAAVATLRDYFDRLTQAPTTASARRAAP